MDGTLYRWQWLGKELGLNAMIREGVRELKGFKQN